MPSSATLCPFCRGLNSAAEPRCYRCGRPLPGPLASGVIGSLRGALSGQAPITRLLLGMCLAVMALSIASDRHVPLWFTDQFTMPTLLRFGALLGNLAEFEPWRYLAAVFAHVNVVHLAMNGWSLLAVGPAAEREFGRARFVVLFVVTGVLGFVGSQWWYGMSPPTVGASGAIFGVFASVAGVAYARRDPNWKQILLQNAVNMAIIGLMFRVNNAAHVVGALSGALLGFLFSKEPRKLKLDIPFGIVAVLLVLLSVASVLLCSASPVWRNEREQEQAQEH